MGEILGLILIIGSATTFRLGGMGFPPFRKSWRRFILPLFLGVIAIIATKLQLEILYAVLTSIVAFHLPYGERTPYWLKCIVAGTFTLPTLFLGYTIWVIIVPIVFIILFALSNNKLMRNDFGHAITELVTGLGIGICWAKLLGLV